jgi:hypothetical protein
MMARKKLEDIKMKITKRQLKRIIKEERSKLLSESRITEEAGLMADLDSIATAIEDIAHEMYGMSGPGTVSGDGGAEMAKQLEAQVERLNTLYDLMVGHFESMDPESHENQRPRPSGDRGDIFTREDR